MKKTKEEIIKALLTELYDTFETATLEDGTEIYVDKLEVGAEVKVLDENGEKVPVFDSRHVLSDGTQVTTVDGKITEIVPKEEMGYKPKDEEKQKMQITDEEKTSIVNEVMQILEPKFQELYTLIADIKSATEEVEIEDEEEMVKKDEKMNAIDVLSEYFKMNKI